MSASQHVLAEVSGWTEGPPQMTRVTTHFTCPLLPTPGVRPSSVAMLALHLCRMSAGFSMNSCKSTSFSMPTSSSSLTTLGSNTASYITLSSPNVFVFLKRSTASSIVMPLYYKSFIFEYLSQNSIFNGNSSLCSKVRNQ